MDPESGVNTWTTGFVRLVDVVVALHAINELELETVNAASRACSECWGASSSWRGFEDCREGVRTVAAKLKRLLDANGRTYRGNSDSLAPTIYHVVSFRTLGQSVYAP